MRPVNLLAILGYACVSGAAYGAPDALDVCTKEPDPSLRLACFDREMQRRHQSAAGAPEQPIASLVGPGGNQKHIEPDDRATHAAPARPLIATISRLIPRSGHLYYFELDNGQVWGQTEAITDLWVSAHESVTITPGTMGGFFLSTRGHQSIRVYRVR